MWSKLVNLMLMNLLRRTIFAKPIHNLIIISKHADTEDVVL